jgi:hypothetical protein
MFKKTNFFKLNLNSFLVVWCSIYNLLKIVPINKIFKGAISEIINVYLMAFIPLPIFRTEFYGWVN